LQLPTAPIQHHLLDPSLVVVVAAELAGSYYCTDAKVNTTRQQRQVLQLYFQSGSPYSYTSALFMLLLYHIMRHFAIIEV